MTLNDLFETIKSRAAADPNGSWTAKLMAKGPEKCAEKFGEEAIEAVIEAVKGDKSKLTSEAAVVEKILLKQEVKIVVKLMKLLKKLGL